MKYYFDLKYNRCLESCIYSHNVIGAYSCRSCIYYIDTNINGDPNNDSDPTLDYDKPWIICKNINNVGNKGKLRKYKLNNIKI